MTLVALEEIRLGPRSHVSALRWLGLLYRRPKSFELSGKVLSHRRRVAAVFRVYLHALPYLLLVGLLGRWFLFNALGLRAEQVPVPKGLWWIAHPLIGGLGTGLLIGLAVGLAVCLAVALAVDLAAGLAVGLASSLGFGLVFGLTHGLAGDPTSTLSLVFGLTFGLACGLIGSLASGFAASGFSGLGLGIVGSFTAGLAVALSGLPAEGFLVAGLAAFFVYFVGFLRLYYLPAHCFWLWPRTRAGIYRGHPVAWDDVCLLPFPAFDRLLVAYAEQDPEAGEREINRLIDEYPTQRRAALRARAILVARRAAAIEDLARLDEILASLPVGEKGFLRETPELRRQVHEITALQAQLDTLDRPFMRLPFARLLVKEIETFGHQIAGFEPPLSNELRNAAQQWLAIARREPAASSTRRSPPPPASRRAKSSAPAIRSTGSAKPSCSAPRSSASSSGR
jgi:hypothetical protein